MFENARVYFPYSSAEHTSADRISQKFEFLLCQWVLNIEDESIFNLARGPWDQWNYLKYFDGKYDEINMCVITQKVCKKNPFKISLSPHVFKLFYK